MFVARWHELGGTTLHRRAWKSHGFPFGHDLDMAFFPNKMRVYHRHIGYVEILGLIDDGLKEIVTGSVRFFEFAK